MCPTCGASVMEHPLVKAGLIPGDLANILVVPASIRPTKKRKRCDRARVLTSEEEIKRRQEEEEAKKRQEEVAFQKKQLRKMAQENKAKLKAEKKSRLPQKAKATKACSSGIKKIARNKENLICNICKECTLSDKMSKKQKSFMQCEFCAFHFHRKCAEISDWQPVYFCSDCLKK